MFFFRITAALWLCAAATAISVGAQWQRGTDRPPAGDDRAHETPAWIPAIDPARYLEHVKFLASDDLQGRGNGLPGLERAADYVGAGFRAAGLAPGAAGSSFFQPFDLVSGLDIHRGNQLVVESGGRTAKLPLGDFYPLSLSGSTAATDARYAAIDAPLVFAGYGIVAPALGYDDYAGLDVSGKAVLALTHEPDELDSSGAFAGGNPAYGSAAAKAATALQRGARLLILVDPTHEAEPPEYQHFSRAPTVEDFGIAVIRARRDRVAAALADVVDFASVARAVETSGRPRPRPLGMSHVRLIERYTRVRARVRNVIGVLRGRDPRLAQEAIVVGAHYDHVGLGGPHSLAPDATGQVHNGADDNASGTAALIEMAHVAAREGGFPRTVVFVAFAGEEIGLLGSSYYVAHPTLPMDRTVAMINLDMVGRPAGRILVTGLDAPLVHPDDIKALQAVTTLEVRPSADAYGSGSSDDAPFVAERVPTVSFFSGFHEDYHRPSDDWARIDPAGGAEVARIALALVRRIAERSN